MEKVLANNCLKCPEYNNKTCDGNVKDCMCLRCPRNLAECIIVRYCRETESPLYIKR
ncbi:hypothetical protein GCM10008909_25220 [Hathewaya limosa]|uniref:Alpha/beta hydrolase n=1 Tax=Hathewaya limosa TaxID=1536 RepID=A0ABU0JY51_HATLI|nr:hypothetical protein [Hathewaya limosa]